MWVAVLNIYYTGRMREQAPDNPFLTASNWQMKLPIKGVTAFC